MNELKIFNNPEFGEIRTVERDGEPWFVGKDVATALGYENPQKAVRTHVDGEDKGETEMDTPGGNQNICIINESGLYSLVLSSKLPTAKEFKRWVTSEVLPTIRNKEAGTNEIAKTGINVNFDAQTISARELYSNLNVATKFTTWFDRMKEYGFSEGIEFFPILGETSQHGGRPAVDYQISMDMAKHICMVQRTPEGKACRKYLIEVEKAWNTPEQVMARALRLAEKTIDNLKMETNWLNQKIETDKPKVLFADAVSASRSSILVGELAKLLKQNGVDIGQNRLFSWMREHGYLIRRKGSDYNMPTQQSMERGLFVIKETAITHSDGSIGVNKTVKVTGKGQQYFVNKFLGRKHKKEFDAYVALMDDELREQVHEELAPCSEEAFLSRYQELHAAKYGAELEV